ncbi:MAG: CDP-glycerol--poly(glycerophosphate) glycerophosphotransferase [Gammaproteobacteria bacterium]|nr:CDP-glycerol--poly(glycerophosphate) glycerophosphotransferase [Gammaproteobacteria bacterium]
MTAHILFDVHHLYYLPQFLPVYRVLQMRGISCEFVVYRNAELQAVLDKAVADEGLPVYWVDSVENARDYYQTRRASWLILGNSFKYLDDLPGNIRTALINHGAGIKGAGHDANMCRVTVRFAEGPYQLRQLQKHYPQGNYVDVGFSKLDPMFNASIKKPGLDLAACGLDPAKPTLLYAPTFYPSSIECMSDHWPAEFVDYNLLVKPHFFTCTKSRYKAQRRKLEIWRNADNVHVAAVSDYNLLPFMAVADLLISDASTALFEFAALDKPVVWCEFLKLRWSYRGLFRYRYTRRMDQDILRYADIAVHARRYHDLLSHVQSELVGPGQHQPQRRSYTRELMGITDGQVSERIVDYLLVDSSRQ